MKFVFVAAPYTHKDPVIREKRIDLINEGLSKLILLYPDWLFINPLFMHYVALKNPNIPTDYTFWKRRSHALIKKCDIFLVMDNIKGFMNSKGLADEISFFQETHPGKLVCNFTSIIYGQK